MVESEMTQENWEENGKANGVSLKNSMSFEQNKEGLFKCMFFYDILTCFLSFVYAAIVKTCSLKTAHMASATPMNKNK